MAAPHRRLKGDDSDRNQEASEHEDGDGTAGCCGPVTSKTRSVDQAERAPEDGTR